MHAKWTKHDIPKYTTARHLRAYKPVRVTSAYQAPRSLSLLLGPCYLGCFAKRPDSTGARRKRTQVGTTCLRVLVHVAWHGMARLGGRARARPALMPPPPPPPPGAPGGEVRRRRASAPRGQRRDEPPPVPASGAGAHRAGAPLLLLRA